MLTPLIAAQLVQRAYTAGEAAVDLSDLGFAWSTCLYATDLNGQQPYGFLATALDGSGQVLAIRGTDDSFEWAQDAAIILTGNPWGPGRVHTGFSRLCGTLRLGVAGVAVADGIGPLSALSLAGHSLGAALARQLSMQLGKVAATHTWGEPRSCDGTAADWAFSCAGMIRRAVNERDLVPMVPENIPPLWPYQHVGTETTVGRTGNNPEQAHAIETYIALEQALLTPLAT